MNNDKTDWKFVASLACVCWAIGAFTFHVARQSTEHLRGEQSVWEQAVEAGVAEIVETKAPNASAYVSREYRWKKCQ